MVAITGTKDSALTEATSVTGADTLAIVQSGSNKKAKLSLIAPDRAATYAAILASTAKSVVYGSQSFVLSSDQSSATDGVLRILRTDTTIIERVWDGVNFNVEWVPLNVSIGTWGTPLTTGDKIAAAASIAPSGATIHLDGSKTYSVSMPITLGSITLNGNGATIKRENQRSSLLTANASIGAFSVTVADASVFRVGSRVHVVKSSGVVGGTCHTAAATSGAIGSLVISIAGNVVTFGDALVQAASIGNKLVQLNLMITHATDAVPTIKNCIIDGNKSQHADVLDWAAGLSVDLHRGYVENCTMQNSPNESIAIGSGSVVNSRGIDLDGSFVHTSIATQSEATGCLVSNCYTKNTNTKDNAHDEGVITFSANSQNVRVVDCVFDNSAGTVGKGVFGLLDSAATGDTDSNFYASNVLAKNFTKIIQVTQAGATAVDFNRIIIRDCTFDKCGDIEIGTANTIGVGPVVKEVKILDCNLVDGWMIFYAVEDLDLSGTIITSSLTQYVFAGSASSLTFATLPTTRMGGSSLVNGTDIAHLQSADGGNAQGIYLRTGGAWVYSATLSAIHGACANLGRVSFYYCGDVKWHGGKIVGHPGSKAGNGRGRVGIQIVPAMVDNDSGTATTTAYGKVSLSDLTIENELFGVMAYTIGTIGASVDDPWDTHPGFDANGWTYTNVKVYAPRDNYWFFPIGLQVPAGCIAQDCTVILPTTATYDYTCGIQLHGPMDATKNVGGVAKNCYVPYTAGTGQSIRLGRRTDNAINANCVAVNNLVAKTPAQAGSRNSIVSGNVIVSSATLAGMTSQTEIYARPAGYGRSLYS